MYWFWIKAFAALLTIRSNGWNLFVRFWEAITISHLFSEQIFFRITLFCPFSVSIITNECCSTGSLFSFSFFWRQGKIIFSKSSMDLSVFYDWFLVKLTEKKAGKSYLGSSATFFQYKLIVRVKNFLLNSLQSSTESCVKRLKLYELYICVLSLCFICWYCPKHRSKTW